MPKPARPFPCHPRYSIVRKLGGGGGGAVYLARDRLDDDSEVALKVSHEEVLADEILQEFRLLRELRHSGIARAFDFGRIPGTGQTYFTMEYVVGHDLDKESAALRRKLRDGDLSTVLDVFLQVVDGLGYIHRRGLLHLDLKPSNMILSEGRVKLIDFGLFRNARAAGAHAAKGTLHYAAPEVLDGRTVDHRSDLYSLGVTFYRIVSGNYPVSGRSLREITDHHRQRIPCPPVGVPEDLSRIIMKLLAKSSRHRFQSAGEVENALRLFQTERPLWRPTVALEVPDFVGRKAELRTFYSWLDSRLNGNGPRTFVVEGEPGMGKTRFLDACLTEMLGQGVQVMTLPDFHVDQGDRLAQLIKRLAFVYGLSRQQKSRYRFLLSTVGLSRNQTSRWEILQLDLAQIRARLFQETLQLLGEWEDRPVILVIDDFHRADAQLSNFVCRLTDGESVAGIPENIGLIISRQSGLLPDGCSGLERTLDVRLKGLKRDELVRSLERLAPVLGQRRLMKLATMSRGSPELYVHLVHQPVSSETGDQLSKSKTTNLSHQRRLKLESLPATVLSTVLFLKLLNQPASEALVRGLGGFSPSEFREARGALMREGLLRVTSRGYFLARDVDDDLLVSRLGEEFVKRARRRIGSKLRSAKGRLHEAALHLILGGKLREGLRVARQAGARLHELGRVEDALALYAVALEYVELASDRIHFLEARGDLLNQSGQFDEAQKAYAHLSTEPNLSKRERLRIKRKLGGVYQRSGDNDGARQVFEEALQLLETVKDLDEHLHLMNELAALHLFRGDFSQSTSFANRGLELLRSSDANRLQPKVRALHDLNLRSVAGHILLRQFEHEPAAVEFLRSLKVSERIGTLSNTALILNNLGVAYFLGNRLRDALRVYNRAAHLARNMGDDTATFSILCNVAGIRARLGEVRAAEELLEAIEEMPHPRRSKRARLFLLHTRGLIARVTLQDASSIWTESIELADEIPDPVLASYGRLYSLENEILQGRWQAARGLLSQLEQLPAKDSRLERAVDSRRAYLDSLCGRPAMARPLATQSYVFDQTLDVEKANPDYGTLWDWIFGGSALLELGKLSDAEYWFERARAVFARLRQPPGVLECSLLLAETALRRRDAKRAHRWLKAARKALSLHDSSNGSRAAVVRIPYLEARLGMLGPKSSRTFISDRLVDAMGNLPIGANWETAWLLNLTAREHGEPGASQKLSASRARFGEGLMEADRKSYFGRDHLSRLGLVRREEEVADENLPRFTSAEKRLDALTSMREQNDVRKVLDLILDACGSRAGAIFLDVDSRVSDARAVEGLGNRFPEKLKAEAIEVGAGTLGGGACAEIRRRGGHRIGVLYVLAPRDEDPGELVGFLQLAGQMLADILSAAQSLGRAARDTTPLIVEDTSRTQSLAAGTFVDSKSPRMTEMISLARRTRDSRLPILLTGESGVGKDLLARWIHSLSPCCDQSFVAVDCAAIPIGLLESELFGYEAGAFTGADKSSKGRLLAADGGSVYLDNVDSISVEAQTKLLRVLDEEEIRAVGGESSIKINARFIASTQRDLRELCARGQFRSDLYFRLSGICLNIPALRERIEDVPGLVGRFQSQLSGRVPEFSAVAMDALKAYSWPGNVRELESLVRRLSLTSEGVVGQPEVMQALGMDETPSTVPRWFFEGRSYDQVLDDVKREYLLYLYDQCAGDTNRLARELKTTRRNVYQRYLQAGLRTVELRAQSPRGRQEDR